MRSASCERLERGRVRYGPGGPATVAPTASVTSSRWPFRLQAALVYLFLYLPIVVVVVFSFNGTNRHGDRLAGVQPQVVRPRAPRPQHPARALEQRDDRDRQRDPGHGVRDDGGARAPARPQARAGGLRSADLRQHHHPRDRHRAGVAGHVRGLPRPVAGPASLAAPGTAATQDRPRPVVDHPGPRALQPEPRPAARPGAPVGHGPDDGRGLATTCSPRRGGRSARSRSRSCCRPSWRASCCRSRSASTTT